MRSVPRGFSRRSVEARSLYTVACVIVASAMAREESRGAHYRNDFPQHDAIARHSIMEKGRLTFVEEPEPVQIG
jgi:L-aspartate oxidase